MGRKNKIMGTKVRSKQGGEAEHREQESRDVEKSSRRKGLQEEIYKSGCFPKLKGQAMNLLYL